MQNNMDATLPDDSLKAVLEDLSDIRKRLPFLKGMTAAERRSAPKLGSKSRAFTERALILAASDDSFLPRKFNVEEFRKDVDLFQKLDRIDSELSRLRELVADTRTLAGSDAYVAALDVYAAAKRNGKAEGLDELTDLLAQRFGRRAQEEGNDSGKAS